MIFKGDFYTCICTFLKYTIIFSSSMGYPKFQGLRRTEMEKIKVLISEIYVKIWYSVV